MEINTRKGEMKMDAVFRKLASEPFYAEANALRAFFANGFNAQTQDGGGKIAISQYGEDHTDIFIRGLMLREKSWITDFGLAVSTEEVIEEIEKALAEEKRINLHMDTGGGLVSGTSNLAKIIYDNRDKIDAYATGVVASAGMWVYAAAGKRYAEDTTIMGSIGVVTSVFDDRKFWENYGIVWEEIVSENAENKRPDVTTEKGKNEVKRYLTSLETIFLEAMEQNLGMPKEEIIAKFNKGGLVTGKEAFDFGAINGIINANAKNKKKENSNMGGESMESLKMDKQKALDDLAASNKQIGELQATISSLNEKISSMEKDHEKAIAEAVEKKGAEMASAQKEIVAMAFEHGVGKEAAIKMVEAGTKEAAGLIALDAKGTSEATPSGDIGNEEPDKTAQEEAVAKAVANRYAIKRGGK